MAADLGGHTFGNFALLQAGLPTLSGVDTAGPTPGGFVGFSVVFSTRP